MTPSVEILLVLGLVAFYVHDSALLLYFDEIVITGTGRGWRIPIGSGLEMGGRYLFIPNPLLPTHALFRSNWLSADRTMVESPADMQMFVRRLVFLRVGCVVLWLLLLLALPVALLTYHDPVLLLAILCVAYATIALMIVRLACVRSALQLTGKDIASLGLEALLCPPHAINLVRKVCLKRGLRGDPLAFAAQTLAPAECGRLRKDIEARIGLFALVENEATARSIALQTTRRHLQEMLP